MAVGPGVLKLAGGLGTAAVIGAGAVAVAADTKPSAAPLKPPVNASSSASGAAADDPASTGTLSIPVTPVCQKSTSGSNAAAASVGARPTPTAATSPALDPALAAALAQLRAARTAQQRQAVLATLTPDQRMQLTAYVNAQRPQPGPSQGASKGSCRGATATGPTDSAPVVPTVVDGGPAAPLVVSAVS